ncbi:LacI family DNA-binding transcriptional regulator [Rathayibacter sp. YIM 133350]|uniref:LacI family DNA-binding transcriptional regulator n=1 Tax=Rathayibacter sp. YIM 133350 TaxID=3131992 RepID=UPI00307E0A49
MAQLPTVADVARLAGVSRQTVSNVLNSPEIVLAETRERVHDAIGRLGYRPHASARRLRTRTSSTIGIRLDPETNGISGAVLDRYLHSLTEQAAERGLRMMLFTAPDHRGEIEQFRTLRDGADVDAVILTATSFRDERIDWLIENDLPFVTFGRPWGSDFDDPDMAWVDVDGFAGTAEATRHLLGRGLKRIGYLGWPDDWGIGKERRDGWERMMLERAGVSADEVAALNWRTDERVPSARQLVERLLAEKTDVEAFVCVSDSLALGAMMAVREAGLPHFPVVGFDNSAVAKAVGLSSVDQRLDLVAEATLRILLGDGRRVLAAAERDAANRHQLITPRLVVRRSSHLAPVEEEAAGTAAGDHDRKERP